MADYPLRPYDDSRVYMTLGQLSQLLDFTTLVANSLAEETSTAKAKLLSVRALRLEESLVEVLDGSHGKLTASLMAQQAELRSIRMLRVAGLEDKIAAMAEKLEHARECVETYKEHEAHLDLDRQLTMSHELDDYVSGVESLFQQACAEGIHKVVVKLPGSEVTDTSRGDFMQTPATTVNEKPTDNWVNAPDCSRNTIATPIPQRNTRDDQYHGGDWACTEDSEQGNAAYVRGWYSHDNDDWNDHNSEYGGDDTWASDGEWDEESSGLADGWGNDMVDNSWGNNVEDNGWGPSQHDHTWGPVEHTRDNGWGVHESADCQQDLPRSACSACRSGWNDDGAGGTASVDGGWSTSGWHNRLGGW